MEPLKKNRVSRRSFMQLSAFSAASALVAAACGPGETPDVAEPDAGAVADAEETSFEILDVVPSEYNEAPMLAERVAAGELPVVDERLPDNPLVVQGLDGIGNYGGRWRMGFSGQADQTAAHQVLDRGLLNFTPDLEVVPYMAESWEVNDDATEFVFHLRQGLRWSDGEPITAEDFIFWYEDFQLNSELSPATPEWLTSVVDGENVPLTLTAPDEHTLVYTFESPNSLFYLSAGIVRAAPVAPAHYLRQYHAEYADADELEATVQAEGFDHWTDLFDDKVNRNTWTNPDLPSHKPWVQLNDWAEELVHFERNPYFWCVDPEGNQLPYIDRLQFRLFEDADVYALWAVNGEIDCQARHVRTSDFTLLRENEASGDYTVQLWRWTAILGIHFNQTALNPELRELFQARDFRIAVSLGIDRDEINELVFNGMGTFMQYGPPVDSPLHHPELSNAYLEYDPDRANEMLDNLGYDQRDSAGYRVFPDSGERIRWTLLGGAQASDEILMVIDDLSDLGFEVNYRGVDRSLSIATHNSNEVECTMGFMDRNLVPLADPQIWVKHTNINDRPWANAWTAWRIDPTLPIAEEPPEDHWIRTIWSLWDQIRAEADEETRNALFADILDIWAEELPVPGILGEVPRLVVVKNGFKGIHEGYAWDCCVSIYEHVIDNATWYWENPEQHS